MQIKFKADREVVICEIHSDRYPIENYYHSFSFGMRDNCGAELLTQHLRKTFGDAVENMREQEYEAGYKAGRQRKRKKRWFSRLLES